MRAKAYIGRYEVLEPLGAGAMGAVFRARDTELERFVALKSLPERVARDAERLARFEREARVLASLSHPNIAALHEVVHSADGPVLVLELAEGETLAERIARGPLPIAEAVAVAAQIAAALEAAHERDVVHRDLKPANVKLRADGTVKLLDFGLAKVLATHADGSGEAEATVTGMAAGGADGVVLGTPAYMSPEQARGLPIDKRADTWAFGCVLFEMLTGRRAFAGRHATDVMIEVIEREPALDSLPAECPPALLRLLRRCFAKDPRQRLRDLGDARLELVDAAMGVAETAADRSAFRRRTLLAAVLVVAVVGAAAVWLGGAGRGDAAAPPRITRFALPERGELGLTGATMAISRDGRRVAVATARGLVLRSLDRLETALVPNSAGVSVPFFSPDGQWLAFTDWHVLKKMPAAGGRVETIADVGPSAMGSWHGPDIFVADMNGLLRVPALGGEPERLAAGPSAQEQALLPQYLEARRAVLYTVSSSPSLTPRLAANEPGARVEALDLVTGRRHVVLRGGGRARYLPTGHLVYATRGTLFAVPFDLDALQPRGEPTAVLSVDGQLEFAVADDGTLVYQAWSASGGSDLVWVDRAGNVEPTGAPPMDYIYPRLSPDGERVALDLNYQGDRDTWVFDFRRSTLERFTRDPAGNPMSAWSPDGRYIAFGSDRFGVTNVFWQAADGSGEPERLLVGEGTQMPITFAPDGRLIYSAAVHGRQRDIYALSLEGERRSEPLVATAANELTAEVSPDGRFIAYDSDESGQFEVYVRSYPKVGEGRRWQISSGGGRQPVWSHDGRELFYRNFEGALMSVSVTLQPSFAPGPATELVKPGYLGGGAAGSARTYDVALDDSRFLMLKSRPADAAADAAGVVVVLDWFAELERLVPIDAAVRQR